MNPFLIVGYQGPKYFCDRRTETETLIAALKNGRNITLISPRRMGKTGLIKNTLFIKKYNLKAASSVNAALKTLKDKEFILKEQQGYIVYDRFLAIWLKRLV